jgi:hypothetical protein
MIGEINAFFTTLNTILQSIKWMEDYGKRMLEAKNKEEKLAFDKKLMDLKEEALKLQQLYQREQEEKQHLTELLQLKNEYIFNEDEGVYRQKNLNDGRSLAYCPKCMHAEKKEAVPLRNPYSEEKERWVCPLCKWYGWSKEADKRMKQRTEDAFRNRYN